MYFLRNPEDALLAIEHDGVGLDAVPKRAADGEVLLRALVANVVLDHLLVAVVCRLVLGARGHGVPGDPSLGHVVEPIEYPGDMEGVVIGGGHSDAEAHA